MPIHLSLPKRYTVLYYECLNYNKKTLADIEEDFNVVYLPDPRHDTKLTERDRSNIVAIFHPISYLFGDGQSVLLRNLRYIVSNTTSTPNITIDNNTGVEIISLEGSPILTNITATAEHTLALIMAVHSRIIPVQSDLSEWNRFNWGRKKMLSEMNFCIVGPGRIGKHLFNMAEHLFRDVNVVGPGDTERYIKGSVRDADILAICASIRPEDRQPIIDASVINQLPKGAIIVNTARSELLDYAHALERYKKGHLSGLGFDVLPGEHNPQFPCFSEAHDHYVSRIILDYATCNPYENIVVTPHIAGSTETAWYKTQQAVVDILKDKLL